MQKVDGALKIIGNIVLVLLGAYIAWCGGVLTGVYGMGLLILPVFPLFILPILALANRQIPWIYTLVVGSLVFSGIAGAGIRTLHAHWKAFGSTDAELMKQLYQSVGLIALYTFGIALMITLPFLAISARREGNGNR